MSACASRELQTAHAVASIRRRGDAKDALDVTSSTLGKSRALSKFC